MWWKGPWEWFRHAQAEVFLKQSFLKELRSKLSFCGQIFTPGPKLSFFFDNFSWRASRLKIFRKPLGKLLCHDYDPKKEGSVLPCQLKC